MDTTTELQPAGDARAAGDSLLEALVIVARHCGIHLSQTQLRREGLHRFGDILREKRQVDRTRIFDQLI